MVGSKDYWEGQTSSLGDNSIPRVRLANIGKHWGKDGIQTATPNIVQTGIENPNPRKQMLHDLANRIEEIKAMGEEVIIMMDSNESLSDTQSHLTNWVRRLELTDIIAHRHGTDGEPETLIRGTERIDYIFPTQEITEFVTATGILGYNNLIQSDHRPLYVDMDLAAFLGGNPSPLENGVSRGIMSSDPRAVRLYREQLLKCLEEEKLVEQLDKLVNDIDSNGAVPDNKLKQELDRLEVLKNARGSCRRLVQHGL
jgi:hypothetical protein